MARYFPLPFNAIIITQLSTIPTVLVQITTSWLELQSLAMCDALKLNIWPRCIAYLIRSNFQEALFRHIPPLLCNIEMES